MIGSIPLDATTAGLLVASYFLGSIPFGVVIARMHGVDILNTASKNPGATNVWRTCGKLAGSLVFALDMLKGLVPAYLAIWITSSEILGFCCGLAAILGHSFSPFIGFRGGKGISTGLGVVIAVAPIVALGSFLVFAAVLALFRYVSLASLCSAVAMCALGFLLGEPAAISWAFVALTLFLFWRHRSNIQRILNGSERKFAFGRNTSPEGPLDVQDSNETKGGET